MSFLVTLVRNLLAWTFALFFWTLVLLLALITLRQIPQSFMHQPIRLWGRVSLWILGIRLVCVNANPFTTRKSRVVICNHQSALDIPIAAAICPPAPLAVGKKEVLYVPLINLAWWIFRFIRIDRKDRQKALKSLAGVAEEVRNHERSFVIAPEGTRCLDGKMGPFKKGAFHIAIQAQAPICPVLIQGAFELMPKGTLLPRAGTVRIEFLSEAPTQGLTEKDLDALLETVRQKMQAHLDA